MNNKVKQLAIKAGWDTYQAQYDTRIEVFAELIVKECANIALREDHDPYECILKHFDIDTVDSTMRNRSTYYGNDKCK